MEGRFGAVLCALVRNEDERGRARDQTCSEERWMND